MKNFEFSLKRMQNYKMQLLDKEKNTLSRLRKRVLDLDNQITALWRYRLDMKQTLQCKQREGMAAGEINSCGFLEKNITIQLEELAKEREKAELEAERQLKVVIAASQELSALDKLEEKQLEEYQVLVAKDNEKIISEFVSYQFIRAQESSRACG